MRNYGKMLVELASVVPDGIVCFFVSYLYMDQIVTSWHEMGILQEVRAGEGFSDIRNSRRRACQCCWSGCAGCQEKITPVWLF